MSGIEFKLQDLAQSNPFCFDGDFEQKVHRYLDTIIKYLKKSINTYSPKSAISSTVSSKMLYFKTDICNLVLDNSSKNIEIETNHKETTEDIGKLIKYLGGSNKDEFRQKIIVQSDKPNKILDIQKKYDIDSFFHLYTHLLLKDDTERFDSPPSLNCDDVILLGVVGGFRDKIVTPEYLNKKFTSYKTAHCLDDVLVHKDLVLAIYQESYRKFFISNPEKLDWLINNAKDVFDNNISNINSGIDYHKQETDSNHFQDIAIRNILLDFNLEFKGNELIRIKSRSKPGGFLSPGRVDFYDRDNIPKSRIYGWWKNGSIEEMYKKSKALVANRKELNLNVIGSANEYVFIQMDELVGYIERKNPQVVTFIKQKEYKTMRKSDKSFTRVSAPVVDYNSILKNY